MVLVSEVYKISQSIPKEEQFGLTSQIRRSAVSIPSNIAEGCGRGTDAQLLYFMDVALGSVCELETQIIIASNLTFINFEQKEEILQPNSRNSKNDCRLQSNFI
jgi:four helix bundle protein